MLINGKVVVNSETEEIFSDAKVSSKQFPLQILLEFHSEFKTVYRRQLLCHWRVLPIDVRSEASRVVYQFCSGLLGQWYLTFFFAYPHI
jgi:hypothetical protein